MDTSLNLLLATDYSSASSAAERYALDLAGHLHARLSMLHVYRHPYHAISVNAEEFGHQRQDLHHAELKALQQHRNALLRTAGLSEKEMPGDCAVREGHIGKAVNEEAVHTEAALVITGTHAAHGLKEFIFGTHTWEIMKEAAVPVLAIPSGADFRGMKKILFATGYRDGELRALRFIAQFAHYFGATVDVLHISSGGLPKTEDLQCFEEFREKVRLQVPYAGVEVRLIHDDDAFSGLNHYCSHLHPDLVVMTPEKPFFAERVLIPGTSLTRKMSFHTQVPLMAVPDFSTPEHVQYKNLLRLFSPALPE
jgi:nucleotide-binding universal stress UspA family protein